MCYNNEMKKCKKQLGISLKLAPKFYLTLLVAIGVILVWRGIWNLVDLYLFPKNPLLSNTTSILIGLFLLYLPDNNIEELI